MNSLQRATIKAAFIGFALFPVKKSFGLRVSFSPYGRYSSRQKNQLTPIRSFKSTTLNYSAANRIEDLGLTLPPPSPPRANYAICTYAPGPTHDKEMMYLSGHLPLMNDGTLLTGFVGPDSGGKSIADGKAAARQAALSIVSTLQNELGDLSRVAQVVKAFGIVNSHTDFKHQHLVMDGFSDTIVEIFGKEVGYHARSAIGTNTLPLDITVEVEAIVRIKSE